jgi:hypothetical protein
MRDDLLPRFGADEMPEPEKKDDEEEKAKKPEKKPTPGR